MSSLEKFTMIEMHRKDLKRCPYNPRKITAEAKRRLKAGLERFGLIQPLIFNKQTGTLVGGHQRLACLDDIHETKDYTLNVAVVDMDPSKEKEAVVFLNNTSSQGFWSDDDLLAILQDESVSADALGFSAQENDYFDRLLKDKEKQDSAAMAYFQEIEESYDTLQAAAEENKEEIEKDKETRKERWEHTVSQYFEPPEPSSRPENQKRYEDLSDEEKKHRDDFRAARENWKKKDTNDAEIIVRLIFVSMDNCRKWLQKNNLPPDSLVVHEKELT